MAIKGEHCSTPVPRAAPWLVCQYEKGKKTQAFYDICEPNSKTCTKSYVELSGKSFWQKPSHQGWLIILCDGNDNNNNNNHAKTKWKFGDCFLWNPVSSKTIQLPTLLHWLNDNSLRDCVLSSPPRTQNNTNRRDDDDSMVFFLLRGSKDQHQILFCRPGDKQWKTQKISEDHIRDHTHKMSLHCCRGKLYVTCSYRYYTDTPPVLEIIKQQRNNNITADITIRRLKVKKPNYLSSLIKGEFLLDHEEVHIAADTCNDLFKICIRFSRRDHLHIFIQVFRLNCSSNAWEDVNSLGDRVLFIGPSTTAICSANELSLSRGCVYYTRPKDPNLYIFEIEDKCTTTLLPFPELPKPWHTTEWMGMISPTTFRAADGARRASDMLCKQEKEGANVAAGREDFEFSKIHDGGELEKENAWVSLNNDTVKLIASYLHPVDYIRFYAVCRENQAILPTINQRTSRTKFSPWLIFVKDNDSVCNLVDPMQNNKQYLIKVPELLIGAKIHYSRGGWLLMSNGMKSVFFFNPFTREIIQLPDIPVDNVLHCRLLFSSLPTSSTCVVLAIGQWIKEQYGVLGDMSIHIIERGKNSWRSEKLLNIHLNMYMTWLKDPVFYNGHIYCVEDDENLGVLSIENNINWKSLQKPNKQFSSNAAYRSFLIECGGDLLLVRVGSQGKSVGVYRLDFSEMIWVEVESLGKHMLFISYTSCLSAIAPCSGMENKIYFPRLQMHGEGILFYSLDTGKYHSFGKEASSEDFYSTKEWLNCSWIEPNWSQSTVQELDWFKPLSVPS